MILIVIFLKTGSVLMIRFYHFIIDINIEMKYTNLVTKIIMDQESLIWNSGIYMTAINRKQAVR